MQSVTSNAVARAFGNWVTIYDCGTGFIKGCRTPMGTFLRIRMSGAFGTFTSTQYLPNGYLLYVIPEGWRPSSTYSPNRFLIAVDTTSVRLPCNIDINGIDGGMRLYFEGNTPIGGGVDAVSGLYCDALLLLQ